MPKNTVYFPFPQQVHTAGIQAKSLIINFYINKTGNVFQFTSVAACVSTVGIRTLPIQYVFLKCFSIHMGICTSVLMYILIFLKNLFVRDYVDKQ